MNDANELRKEIEKHERLLDRFRADLNELKKSSGSDDWSPSGFYLSYHILAGMLLGAIASWVVLGLNVVGASLMSLDPLQLLRVYSTFIGGSATAQSNDAVVVAFAIGLHTTTGVVCGAPIHVLMSSRGQTSVLGRMIKSVVLGLIMWVVNYYAILSWLQPMLTAEGSSYIVDNIPVWVAMLSHVAFAFVVIFLQPLASFEAAPKPESQNASG